MADHRPIPDDSAPRVTIIVSPRERFEQAQMSLAAIFDTADVPFKLIYVDGGSPKPIGAALQARVDGAGQHYIRREIYLSPNQARNIALPLVDTDYVAFVDNDVIFQRGWLSALIACADETGAGLVTPTILIGPESRMPDLKIHHAGGFLDFTATPEGLRMGRRHGHEHEPYLANRGELKRGESDVTEFHTVLARKTMLDQIGAFDEQLVGFTDEVEMALLARQRGWKIFFEPSAVVAYSVGRPATWRERPFFCVRWSGRLCMRAERYFYEKWNLVPEFSHQRNFLRDHRRHIFRFRRLEKLVGWRLTVWLTTALCETIGFVASFNMNVPKPTGRTKRALWRADPNYQLGPRFLLKS